MNASNAVYSSLTLAYNEAEAQLEETKQTEKLRLKALHLYAHMILSQLETFLLRLPRMEIGLYVLDGRGEIRVKFLGKKPNTGNATDFRFSACEATTDQYVFVERLVEIAEDGNVTPIALTDIDLESFIDENLQNFLGGISTATS